jgi:hypothetical protein
VRCGFPSNPVISFSAVKYLAFSVRHDDINGPIGIPLVAGYTNNLVRGEHVIFIVLPCFLVAALLKFFWVQLSDSISSPYCHKHGGRREVSIWKQLVLNLFGEKISLEQND